MDQNNDIELLRQYADDGCEPAFAALVERHVNLVYSAALRQVNDPHLAEEVSQIVFLILAKKAGTLGNATVFSGWLYRTARFAARDALKSRRRREQREQEAFHMDHTPSDSAWEQIAPFLDEAMATLGEQDRNAVVLRYFEQKPLADVGRTLGVDADAAQKRVTRAVDKLRKFLVKRGLVLSATALAGALGANAVQAAPAALPAAITTFAAVKGTAAAGSTATLINGTLKLMAWTKLKTTIVVGTVVLLIAGTATIAVREIQNRPAFDWQAERAVSSQLLSKAAPQVSILPTITSDGGWCVFDNKVVGLGQPAWTVLVAPLSITRTNFFRDFNPTRARTRMVIPDGLPPERYDFIANLSKGSAEALRAAAEQKFGATAGFEMREADVLLLSVKRSGAAGLKPNSNPKTGGSAKYNQPGSYTCTNSSIGWDFATFLEDRFQIPVLDRTGLTGNFDVDLRWDASGGFKMTPKELNSLKQALLEQLGLELVPSHETIEMLVIEKVK